MKRKLCKCGCGEFVTKISRTGTNYCDYNSKHKRNVIRKECLCGCGEIPKGINSNYSVGHSSLGNVPSLLTRKKISEANKGKRKGTKRNPKATKKMIETRVRNKKPTRHSNQISWRKYHLFIFNSGELKRLKKSVIRRDKKCILCSKNTMLIAHHIIPSNICYDDKLCDTEGNLITLCRGCHTKVHKNRNIKQNSWHFYVTDFIKYLLSINCKSIMPNSKYWRNYVGRHRTN